MSSNGFAVAPETTNVVNRAVEVGSQAEWLGLDSEWFAQMASYDAFAAVPPQARAGMLGAFRWLGAPELLDRIAGLPHARARIDVRWCRTSGAGS